MHEGPPRDAALRVRLVIFDVDGTLTDGGVYIGATNSGEPVELKKFDIVDGLGLKLLGFAGLEVAILSGRSSEPNRLRALELDIDYHEGPGGYKLAAAEKIVAERGMQWNEVACLCDDLPDLPLLRRAGLPAAVANAVPEVKALASWVTSRAGGAGAAREFCEALLRARGEWDGVVERYAAARERGAA